MAAPTCTWWVDGIPEDCGQPATWRIAGTGQLICADHVEAAELAGRRPVPMPGATTYDAGRGNRARRVHGPECRGEDGKVQDCYCPHGGDIDDRQAEAVSR